MKKLVMVAALMVSTSAFAETTVLSCVVPNDAGAPAVSLEMVVGDDVSIDFVTLNVTSKAGGFTVFNQMDKGSVAEMLKVGEIGMLVLGENFGQVDGVIKDAGIFQAAKRPDGMFEGVMIVKGDVYPLLCEAK